MRQAQIAEQDRVYQQSINTEKEKAVGAALQIIRSGGTLKNDTLCYYKDDGSFVETSLILYLMREYHIDVPLRTHRDGSKSGWQVQPFRRTSAAPLPTTAQKRVHAHRNSLTVCGI